MCGIGRGKPVTAVTTPKGWREYRRREHPIFTHTRIEYLLVIVQFKAAAVQHTLHRSFNIVSGMTIVRKQLLLQS